MLKNNKAVTMIVLIVTVIAILILGGTTVVTSDALIKKTKKKTIITNMYLVKSEVETIYEEYQFNGDINTLEGDNLFDIMTYEKANKLLQETWGAKKEDGDLWYLWNRDTLSKLGFDPEMLPEKDSAEETEYFYVVNYTTGEIIYTPGFKETTGERIYTLTAMSSKSNEQLNDEGI